MACESPGEELDDREDGHCGRGLEQAFEVFGEAAIASQRGEGALDHPSPRQQVEALGVARALDDLEPQPLACRSTERDLALVTGIGEQVPQPGEAPSNPAADQLQPVSILDIGGMDDQPQRQACVSVSRWRLRPFTFLPASNPRGPPASVVFKLWLSTMPAVGEASRPACSRAAMSSVVWMLDQMPSCQNRRK